jgi:UDP-N-acetylglucosamine transferase subunit ALG13
MIFVTVGNSIKGVEFHRLIREMDVIARDLSEEVVAQVGYIEDPPRHLRSFSYLNYVEIMEYFKRASMIVGHGGVGTVIHALTYGKPLILVPRSKAYGEHIDDHQAELAHKLREREGIFVVDEMGQLRDTILRVKHLVEEKGLRPRFSNERNRLFSFLEDYLKRCRAGLDEDPIRS